MSHVDYGILDTIKRHAIFSEHGCTFYLFSYWECSRKEYLSGDSVDHKAHPIRGLIQYLRFSVGQATLKM